MRKPKPIAYCQISGYGYLEKELRTHAIRRGLYYYCTCHQKRLVMDYPWVIKKPETHKPKP